MQHLRNFLLIIPLITLTGAGCTVTIGDDQSDDSPQYSDTLEIGSPKFSRTEESTLESFAKNISNTSEVTLLANVWNEDNSNIIVTWTIPGHKNAIGVLQAIKEEGENFQLVDSYILTGDINHLFIDDANWVGDAVHFNVFITDEGGTRIEPHVLGE